MQKQMRATIVQRSFLGSFFLTYPLVAANLLQNCCYNQGCNFSTVLDESDLLHFSFSPLLSECDVCLPSRRRERDEQQNSRRQHALNTSTESAQIHVVFLLLRVFTHGFI